ncbi:hypothetical protein ACFUC1_06375 [Pedococcus sp. NPDC057267]|uniref:hypothetical protein n=1 Tax=Pedococcus sp. NPDC057267 TaxID=3346077 RepID=UPI0036458644
MGVVQGDVGIDDAGPQPAGRPWWRRWNRRRVAVAVGVVAAVGVTMCLTGIGTGEGPLGPTHWAAGAGASRDVGDEFTEGAVALVNDGWFDVHLESVRPVPATDTSAGLAVTSVQLAPRVHGRDGIGLVDGSGAELVPLADRRAPAGYTIPRTRDAGPFRGSAEVLVTYRVTRPGTWKYRGYEVVYRSGLVRHRVVMPFAVSVCTPAGKDCGAGN